MDKIKELEERLDRLESRLKSTFLEIERRLESMKIEEPSITGFEDRLQELEDVLLLLQLEITKLKEKTSDEFDIGPAPQLDVTERLQKLEEAVSVISAAPHTAGAPKASQRIEARIESLERKVEERLDQKEERHELSGKISEKLSELEEKMKHFDAQKNFSGDLDQIEQRLERLESTRVAVVRPNVLDDIRKILEA